MNGEYIHYGASSLCEITPIKNEHCFTKPRGGLWASAVDAKFGWKDWCLRENFFTGKLERFFIFKLKPDAKIIHIYSIDDLEGLPQLEHELSSWTTLDFEQLAKEYDGIELHLSEERPPKKRKKGDGITYILNCTDGIVIVYYYLTPIVLFNQKRGNSYDLNMHSGRRNKRL